MAHMSKAWGLPPKRYFPRETREGTMKLTCGMNSTYFFVNKEVDFIAPELANEDADEMFDSYEDTAQRVYSSDEWSLVDQGPGGFAVIKNDKPRETVRVGDLVGIADAGAKTSADKWNLGIIRWLMIRQNKIYKVGIQMIGKKAHPVAIRACNGSQQELQYRRAFLMDDPADKSKRSIITAKGIFTEERELEVNYNNQNHRFITNVLEESTVSFEHFSVN